jgi:CubicO group peptidase (beta-lactamase class C family)
VYVGQEKVIDLYGVTPETTQGSYDADTKSIICSNGKVMSAVVLGTLVEQGLISYEDKVAQHWPEFAQHGKGDITISDVLRHDAKLHCLKSEISLDWGLPENIKKNMIGEVIEQTKPCTYPYGLNRSYHAVSKDWITNEIFRRVEPQGRTMGEYYRDEIKDHIGADICFIMTEEEADAVYPV